LPFSSAFAQVLRMAFQVTLLIFFNVFDVLDASIPRCPCGQKVISDA
jgi:hypothetical protein